MSKKKDNKKFSLKKKTIGGIKKDKDTCHHCENKGYGIRNCKEYLATIKTSKLNKTSTSDMFRIERHLTTLHCSSWILDTQYGFYICNYLQELKKKELWLLHYLQELCISYRN